jgi:hypothetical protein
LCAGECENRQDAVEEFLCAVRSLCKESKNDWYRVYLIRNISSQQGVEYVQRMLRDTETYRWLFPEEVQQQVHHRVSLNVSYNHIKSPIDPVFCPLVFTNMFLKWDLSGLDTTMCIS